MKKHSVICVMIAFALLPMAAQVTPPPVSVPGDSVTVKVTNHQDQTKAVTFKLSRLDAAAAPLQIPSDTIVQDTQDKDKFTFVIAPDTPSGLYQITPEQKDNSQIGLAPPVQLRIWKPAIEAVDPKIAFPEKDGMRKFSILGAWFPETFNGGDKPKYEIRFVGENTPKLCSGDEKIPREPCYTISRITERQIAVELRDDASTDQQASASMGQQASTNQSGRSYAGHHKISLLVSHADAKPNTDKAESNTADITLSKYGTELPKAIALIFLGALIVLVYFLLRSGRKGIQQKIDGKTYFLSTLFLDQQSNSYSLSQCQFYAWTATAILGYVYLVTSRSLIQGSLTFPDIPGGLPGILLASAGTGILAGGIASAKGNKGAGDIQPSLSDFITTGGVVAAERLQFVVWTIVGISTFLSIVFLTSPATINDLPRIPDGFLQLMGISSAGYLAGKMVRKAGPAISAIGPSADGGKLILQITGSALSESATFSIGDSDIPTEKIQRGDGKNLPEVVQKDETASEGAMARILKLTINAPDPSWFGTDRTLTIRNPDAQKAVSKYSIPSIRSATLDSKTGALELHGAFEQGSQVTSAIGGNSVAVSNLIVAADVIKATVVTKANDVATIKVTGKTGATATITITAV